MLCDALTSIDPRRSAIVAVYGGPDFVTSPRNAATQDVAQGGSTFKPFTLIAALEQGITLEDTYASYSPMEIEGYDFPVSNFDSPRNRGRINLLQATENSVNTVYVQLNRDAGPENTVDVATRLGLPADTAGLEPVISNVLGTASPHPIDMATAFATIAAQGVRYDRYIVAEARGVEGNVLYTGGGEGTRMFDAQVMADATYAMTRVVECGTGETASELDRPVAGKTGSSNSYRSAWFVGSVPQLTTAVAMYQVGENGEEAITPFGGVNPVAGSSWPTTIWTEYMKVAVDGMAVEDFPERSEPARPSYVPPATQAPTEAPTTEEPTEPTTEEPPTPTTTPTLLTDLTTSPG